MCCFYIIHYCNIYYKRNVLSLMHLRVFVYIFQLFERNVLSLMAVMCVLLLYFPVIYDDEQNYSISNTCCFYIFADMYPSQTDEHLVVLRTGLKTYSCNICKKICASQVDLDRHMRKHTGEKPYVCQMCSKAFSQSSNMYAHMRARHGIGFLRK